MPRDTGVLTVGLHPGALDYGSMPDRIDEAALTARIAAGRAALRDAGFDTVSCLVDADPERAEAALRERLGERSFGLVMIGAGVRMIPEHTPLFERLLNVLIEEAPGTRVCFNTSPESTLDALRRWIEP
ncbi:hypothetical protein JNUCC64_09170 [Streptomyces sp. JNUCC 64]